MQTTVISKERQRLIDDAIQTYMAGLISRLAVFQICADRGIELDPKALNEMHANMKITLENELSDSQDDTKNWISRKTAELILDFYQDCEFGDIMHELFAEEGGCLDDGYYDLDNDRCWVVDTEAREHVDEDGYCYNCGHLYKPSFWQRLKFLFSPYRKVME